MMQRKTEETNDGWLNAESATERNLLRYAQIQISLQIHMWVLCVFCVSQCPALQICFLNSTAFDVMCLISTWFSVLSLYLSHPLPVISSRWASGRGGNRSWFPAQQLLPKGAGGLPHGAVWRRRHDLSLREYQQVPWAGTGRSHLCLSALKRK